MMLEPVLIIVDIFGTLAHRSRCFSYCLPALNQAVKLFIFAWNRCQFYKQPYPANPAHVMDFRESLNSEDK